MSFYDLLLAKKLSGSSGSGGGSTGECRVLFYADAETGDTTINPSYETARTAWEAGQSVSLYDITNGQFDGVSVFHLSVVGETWLGFGGSPPFDVSRGIDSSSEYDPDLDFPF